MMSARSVGGVDDSPSPARRPSRYESQKRRDWQTFTRYLGAHRPPLQLRRCSGAHVLEFLRYLDRFGKTRVHAPPCPAYGAGPRAAPAASSAPAWQCPLRQAWGSLDALVGRLRAAFDERHGARGTAAAAPPATAHQNESGGATATANNANPFAARAVRLYLRDVRDAQARARGISYSRKKKRRTSSKQQQQASGRAAGAGASATASEQQDRDVDAAVGCARPHGSVVGTALMSAAAAPPAPAPQQYLAGVQFECCEYYGSVIGGPTTTANTGVAGFYLPLLFNSFG